MSVLFWVLLAVGLAVIEILSVTFFPIFFTISALLALAVSLAGGDDWLQWLVFGIAGLLFSAALRPIAQRQLASGPTLRSSVEQMQGRRGVVRDAIDGRSGTGTVVIDGEVWSAKAAGDAFEAIPEGADVEIHEVRGATVIVAPLSSTGVL